MTLQDVLLITEIIIRQQLIREKKKLSFKKIAQMTFLKYDVHFIKKILFGSPLQ